MTDIIQANWLAFVVVLLIGLAIAWWLFGRASRPSVRERRPDVLDEGAEPARRNQALIDSPAAAAIVPPTMVDTMGGAGEAIAAGARGQTANAEAEAWEEVEAAEETAAPVPASVPEPSVPDSEPDDLRKLKGVGPKLVAALHALGVTRYAQIAGWSEADIDRIDAGLGAFAGRIRRDNWIEQAQLLENGDTAAYEAKFGNI